jgi:disulfide bond formation protein DsbB
VGQSDPVRFSFNPAHWVWSLGEWAPAPIGLRGRYLVPHPSLDGVNADPAAGPFASLPVLGPATAASSLPGLDGPVSGLAYDAATGRFAVSTRHGVWIVSGDLSRPVEHVVVDPTFSVDLGEFGDTAFLDSRTVMAVSENKSYVILREDAKADPSVTYRFFVVPGPFDEVTRGRFATVRAKMLFVRAAAFDPVVNAIITVGLPNLRSPRLVVSAFDRGDLALSQEFLPAVDPAPGLALRSGRSIDELYVTAATVHEGRLWALSAAYSTLVTIDVNTRRVTGAWAVPGLRRPAGVAVQAGRLVVAGEDGSVVSVPLPAGGAGR